MDNLARFSIWDWEQSQKEKKCPCCDICKDYITSDGLFHDSGFGIIHRSHLKRIFFEDEEIQCAYCERNLTESALFLNGEYICDECEYQAGKSFDLLLWYG